MYNSLSEEDKIGEILLNHRHPKFLNKLFLVVEGASDVKLFSHLIEDPELVIEPSYGGKKQVINIITSLHKMGDKKVIGICDADFDRLDGLHELYHDHCLYMTDVHDIEMMMILSKSKRKLVSEFCSLPIVNDVEDNFINVVCGAAYNVGIFRWLNKNEGGDEGLRLNFRGITYSNFIKFSGFSFEFDFESFVCELIKRTTNIEPHITKEYLIEKYHLYKSKMAPVEQVCCGHDMSELACIFINQDSIRGGVKIKSSTFESMLRTSYEQSCFAKTELYSLFSRGLEAKRKELKSGRT